MKKKFKKQEIIFVIVLLLIVLIIGAFSIFHDKEFHYLDHLDETFVTVDGNELPLKELGFYVVYEETLGSPMAYEYDHEDTKAFWGRHTNGNFISSLARESAVAMAVHDEIFYQQALSHQITLTEEESDIAELRLQDYLNAITPEQLEMVNLTEDDLRATVQKIALGEKYMLIYAKETGHYYEEYNISGDAYQELLQEHDVKENKYLINKLVFGEISLNDSES